MLQRTAILILAAIAACGLGACKKSAKEQAAAAKARVLAEKKVRAIKAYDELVKKYPESPFAEKAKEHLRTLGPAVTPAKKK